MKFSKIFFVSASCVCATFFTACGDMNPVSLKLATSLVKKYDQALGSDRQPEAVTQRFLEAFAKADFERALLYCDGNAKIFMEACIANQKLQNPKDHFFWDKELINYTSSRIKNLVLQNITVINQEKTTESGETVLVPYAAELIYSCPASLKICLGGEDPRAFDIAQALFPANVVDTDDEKAEQRNANNKKMSVLASPEKKVLVIVNYDPNTSRWMVSDLAAAPDAEQEAAAKAENADLDQEFMDLAAQAEEEEKAKKKAAAPPKEIHDSGQSDDFGFEMP